MAYKVRKKLGLTDQLFFPVVEVMESLPLLFPEFYYEIVEDDELPAGAHADMNVLNQCMRIKKSVYEGACKGWGRDRMTIAHELGHFFTLCIAGFKLQRNFSGKALKSYEDPEWQASCFAGELLMPAHLIKDMDILDVEVQCGVTIYAVMYQFKKISS
jgi:Zn-dependent peptidase ImmA (M78 family)